MEQTKWEKGDKFTQTHIHEEKQANPVFVSLNGRKTTFGI